MRPVRRRHLRGLPVIAPNITPADVEATIASEHYFTGAGAMNGTDMENVWRVDPGVAYVSPLCGVQFCVLVLKNGHVVTGEAMLQDLSKPDPERARASARRRAFDKAYDMVVYAERERLAAAPMVATATPEQLAELREAVRNAPSMPLVLEPILGISWMAIDPANPATLPEKGYWLVTVDSDDGREVHVLWHSGGNKWLHDGEYTFQHGYHFRPVAWAPRPDGYTGEVLE